MGEILDEISAAGANVFRSISFGIDDPAGLRDAARRDAVRDAQARAALYADEAGVKLGLLQSLREIGASQPRPQAMAMAREMAAAAPVPVAGGELTLRANIEAVFAIE